MNYRLRRVILEDRWESQLKELVTGSEVGDDNPVCLAGTGLRFFVTG
jgi:hypothetical protein